MAVVIHLIAPAIPLPPGHPALALVDTYVVSYNPHAAAELWDAPMLITTPWIDGATLFTAAEALAVWQEAHGLRPDGKPNRPLTAFTVSLDQVEDRP